MGLLPVLPHAAPLSRTLVVVSRRAPGLLVRLQRCHLFLRSHWRRARYHRCDGRIRGGEQPPANLAAPYFTPSLTSPEPVSWDPETLTSPLLEQDFSKHVQDVLH
ncbi:hypothetical protein RRF57_006222 [Xylaria bambusicola]|uniref:Uncharacterized protein n=1 Tax=Xylaria bambusicola TaxID=326684 RepID=A0AAN7UKU9_9PEZI